MPRFGTPRTHRAATSGREDFILARWTSRTFGSRSATRNETPCERALWPERSYGIGLAQQPIAVSASQFSDWICGNGMDAGRIRAGSSISPKARRTRKSKLYGRGHTQAAPWVPPRLSPRWNNLRGGALLRAKEGGQNAPRTIMTRNASWISRRIIPQMHGPREQGNVPSVPKFPGSEQPVPYPLLSAHLHNH